MELCKRRKILFVLLVCVACFGLLEGGLRIFWERPPLRLGDGLRKTGPYVRDPELGWRALPNRRVVHQAPARDVIVTTNSRGFRDIEHGPKKPGVFRVVVLGDSFPLGYGVEDDENFVCYLRAEVTAIKRTCDGAGIPLVVAAVPAREAIEPDARRRGLSYATYDEQDFDHDKPCAALGALCRELDVAYVCPLGAFRKGKDLYSRWDIHFSPKGHRLFAKAIAPKIRERLPDGP